MRDTGADIGRTGAVERLYREQGDRIWRALLAYAGDPEVASDAEAEAFAQLLRRGDEVRDSERWVWRAAFRIAAGELQNRRREVELVQKLPLHETAQLMHCIAFGVSRTEGLPDVSPVTKRHDELLTCPEPSQLGQPW